MQIRTGLGYDVHRLAPGETLILGGVSVPYELGTVAHSDGDVLLHAISDALLGAAALKDIGYHFPDTDDRFKDANSLDLLKQSYQLVKAKGFTLSNIDATIAMQRPKLKPFIDEMCAKIANTLGIEIDSVSVKATTTEKLGFVGKEEGIEAFATVLIISK
ncbi:MAG: 2-C-methyl-D-erythritol 2,4-cyclodiphosphate synthase [Salinivirgaceae bacterium]|nr:MAG: 2-C-methyl-D-erythritol 2,4-cyclodiphosphate synthase [Salinivirgaceae bacterium]